jgi:hypothetical protein
LKELTSTPNSENISEVCSGSHSSISHCSHQDGSFGAFEKHTRGIGLKFLTKMGYEGIINPIEVMERPRYLGLGYGEVDIGEFSKTLEASDASNDQPKSLWEQFMKGDGVSLHDGDSEYNSSPKLSEDQQERYNVHGFSKSLFDYKKHNHVIQNLWNMYPCTFFHSPKNCVAKCWKIQSLYRNFMSARKETRHKDSTPQ